MFCDPVRSMRQAPYANAAGSACTSHHQRQLPGLWSTTAPTSTCTAPTSACEKRRSCSNCNLRQQRIVSAQPLATAMRDIYVPPPICDLTPPSSVRERTSPVASAATAWSPATTVPSASRPATRAPARTPTSASSATRAAQAPQAASANMQINERASSAYACGEDNQRCSTT